MNDDLKRAAQEAGQRYDDAVSLGKEDLNLRAVKYLLLRLTVGGLKPPEVETLRALARAAFFEADVTSQAEEILRAEESSPLAVALANVVAAASGSKRTAMIGAILGAHAALSVRVNQNVDDGQAEVRGAIVGAAIFETRRFLEEDMLGSSSWSDFATRD